MNCGRRQRPPFSSFSGKNISYKIQSEVKTTFSLTRSLSTIRLMLLKSTNLKRVAANIDKKACKIVNLDKDTELCLIKNDDNMLDNVM